MMSRNIVILAVLLSAASISGAANFPQELEGGRVTWQSRASMYLNSLCVKQKCDSVPMVSGEPILLGAVYFFGTETVVVEFNQECTWDGEMCGFPAGTEVFTAWLTWDEDAQAYLKVVDIAPGEAEFISLTMTSGDAGELRVGVFDVVGGGKVFKYSKDYERQVFTFQRWWPEMPQDPGPA